MESVVDITGGKANCLCTKEKEIAIITEQVSAIFKRMDEQTKLAQHVHELVVEMRYMRDDMQTVKTDMVELKSKPSKRWDSITASAITAIVGGLIAFVLFKLGMP